MKSRLLSVICLFCAVSLMLSCFTSTSASVSPDEPVGKMSAVYGYVLNDYLLKYGTYSTGAPGEVIYGENGELVTPNGVVYSDIVNFDANENPYLVIFVVESAYCTASCHIWRFNEETEQADQIAELTKNYWEIPDDSNGEFNVGWNGDKRYISYKEYVNNQEVNKDYYTVVDGDAFIYVNDPQNVTEVGVMDFNRSYFHAGVDVSNANRCLSDFFDNLKNAAADSVSYENISERLSSEDEAQVEAALSEAVKYEDFDIARYSSFVRYESALDALQTNTDRFYLISNMYNLGDELYYVRFSTDRSYYNYALLRRSPDAETGYQILKVRTDCIPLSDIELKELKEQYKRNTLLYKKEKGSLKLEKESKYITDVPAEPSCSTQPSEEKKSTINIEKRLCPTMRLPVACIGGGISIALLTALWLYLSSDDK